MTYNQRTRDPDLTADGKWITFTLTDNTTTGLALAPVIRNSEGEYHLGDIQRVYMPPTAFDRVGNPQFSANGKEIYFSYHPNGKAQEDILKYEIESKTVTSLVSDGKFNRFPIVNGDGELFFISDKTRADNLYRYLGKGKAPVLATNMTTGLNYPAFGPKENSTYPLYGGVSPIQVGIYARFHF